MRYLRLYENYDDVNFLCITEYNGLNIQLYEYKGITFGDDKEEGWFLLISLEKRYSKYFENTGDMYDYIGDTHLGETIEDVKDAINKYWFKKETEKYNL